MGYKYQFITLAGIHNMWFNMFDLTQEYVKKGMTAYVEKVQEPEFAARDRGYTFRVAPAGGRHRLLRRGHPGHPGRTLVDHRDCTARPKRNSSPPAVTTERRLQLIDRGPGGQLPGPFQFGSGPVCYPRGL